MAINKVKIQAASQLSNTGVLSKMSFRQATMICKKDLDIAKKNFLEKTLFIVLAMKSWYMALHFPAALELACGRLIIETPLGVIWSLIK